MQYGVIVLHCDDSFIGNMQSQNPGSCYDFFFKNLTLFIQRRMRTREMTPANSRGGCVKNISFLKT